MISFLFWNIKNNPIQSIIARLALRHEVDVIMLAECDDIPPCILLSKLMQHTGNMCMYNYIQSIGCDKIEIYTRFSSDSILAISESDRYTIRHLKLPESIDILLSVAHLQSKTGNIEKTDQDSISKDFSESIKQAEKDIGHSRTVVFGDLNMSPFDSGIIMASGLNATMSRFIAQGKPREVRNEYYPPGTYYYVKSTEEDLRWYILDQVLIRPDLLDYFDIKDLKILTSDGSTDFLSRNGIPLKKISDHLPIFFRLNI
jgi:hypothetical protein